MRRPTQVDIIKSMPRRRRELAEGGTSDLFDLVGNGSAEQVAEALVGLPEPRRREIGVELTAWFKKRDKETWWTSGPGTALAVAVVGCLPTAAQAAAIIGRASVPVDGTRAARLVLAVAEERGVTWLGDLAYRVAARFGQRTWVDGWLFVAALLQAEGSPPPTDDRSVQLWLSAVQFPDRGRRGAPTPVADRIRDDPFLPAMLTRLFEVDGIGTQMMFDVHWKSWDEPKRHALLTALTQLAAEGVVDRAALVDGALGRLLRGDRPTALRAFTTLLGLLALSTAEIAARATDHLRLLTDAPAPVATMAQKALRQVPDLELESVLDASRQVLTRPDKALVRTQLTWLDKLARQHPDRATEIAEVIALGAEHPAVELRDRATALATRHGVAPVPPDLGAAVTGPRGDDLPAPTPPAPAPEPITDVDELAEEVAALLGTRYEGASLERILDGLVRFTATDAVKVRTALDPVIERRHWSWANEHQYDPLCLCQVLVDVFTSAGVDQPTQPRSRWQALLAAVRRSEPSTPELVGTNPRVPPVHRLLRARLVEIGAHVTDRGDTGLLSLPTSANGTVDPLALVERLAALGGRTPGHWDLTQALLRLPTDADEAVAGKAAALGTPAGDRLAAWLRDGGLPQPVMRQSTLRRKRKGQYNWDHPYMPPERLLVELSPPDGHADPDGLLTLHPSSIGVEHTGWVNLWPSLLPGHRGVVAASVLPLVANTADIDQRDGTAVLPLLAETTGPGGIALDLAMAYGLGARHAPDRVATLDALLTLAAADQLDAGGTGTALGTLATGERVKLSRVVEPLRDAAQAGAPLTVWRLLAATLPALLSAPTTPRGTIDMLTLATETATTTGVRLDVPGLAEVAARGGSSRLVTEARRLHQALQIG
ncbi:DUF6493 family protein [Micromonospora sp. NPDC002389]|uniref:DUF6493 family protein n=1 Tax=Micromonospora sp. NPDC002389 TaxID=3154272 RepID=UPI0033216A79